MDEDFKAILLISIFVDILIIAIIISIAIPCLISEKRNIEKELKMKELEIYGEYRDESEK